MKRLFGAFALAALIAAPLAQPASAQSPSRQSSSNNGVFSTDLAVGVMSGRANEYVYNPNGSTLSKLIWRYDNNVMLNGGMTYTPMRQLTLGMKGRINLSGQSTMDDYDYPGAVCGIAGSFCQSHHDDTTLKRSTSVDLYGAYNFFATSTFKASALAGYRWDHSSWEARGGTSNYAPPFPNIPVISYQQWWEAPYLGLAVGTRWDRWTFDGRIIGSFWAKGHDRDDHHLRTTLFTEEFKRSNMMSINAKVGYELTRNLAVTLGYDYDFWGLAKGPTNLTNYVTGQSAFVPGDAAGASSTSHTVSLGVRYGF